MRDLSLLLILLGVLVGVFLHTGLGIAMVVVALILLIWPYVADGPRRR